MKLSEIFFSIQGEGLEIGLPTVFVRLFACDLRCNWCDTMYAVEGRDFVDVNIADVIKQIEEYNCKRVCITGGEPLIQKKEVEQLAEELLDNGYSILLETSGHKEPPSVFFTEKCIVSLDCKCPSSGMQDRMDFELYKLLRSQDQLKFVIQDNADYNYAVNILRSNDIEAKIIFQPVSGGNLHWLTQRVLEDGLESVRVLRQLHKYIWGNKRGV